MIVNLRLLHHLLHEVLLQSGAVLTARALAANTLKVVAAVKVVVRAVEAIKQNKKTEHRLKQNSLIHPLK